MCTEKQYLKPSKKLCAEGQKLYNYLITELEQHRQEIQSLRLELIKFKDYSSKGTEYYTKYD